MKPRILLNMAYDVHNNRECHILIESYARRVLDAGALPVLMPTVEDDSMIREYLAMSHGVLFIGGKDYLPECYGQKPHPETSLARLRPMFDLRAGKLALETDLPILGICAGCQLLAILHHGMLIQHLFNAKEVHTGGKIHEAVVLNSGWFAKAIGKMIGEPFKVNSFHHQAADPDHPGEGLLISGRAFDGSVEAVERPGSRMVLGVQFHPERMDDLGPKIFQLLVSEAEKRLHS